MRVQEAQAPRDGAQGNRARVPPSLLDLEGGLNLETVVLRVACGHVLAYASHCNDAAQYFSPGSVFFLLLLLHNFQ